MDAQHRHGILAQLHQVCCCHDAGLAEIIWMHYVAGYPDNQTLELVVWQANPLVTLAGNGVHSLFRCWF